MFEFCPRVIQYGTLTKSKLNSFGVSTCSVNANITHSIQTTFVLPGTCIYKSRHEKECTLTQKTYTFLFLNSKMNLYASAKSKLCVEDAEQINKDVLFQNTVYQMMFVHHRMLIE